MVIPLPQYTVPQLERMLKRRRGQLELLMSERRQLVKQIATLDNKVRSLGGTRVGDSSLNAAGRVRNAVSLIDTLVQVLTKARKALTVSEILEGVLATGYRSTSPNFRGIVNMTLIKERKRFKNIGRATYALAR